MHSSTLTIPDVRDVPRHVAIIMDGNGRWAKKRLLPRVAGHKRGLEAVREAVRFCCESGIDYLTLFAFSSENWRRPPEEVSFLMGLFLQALEREVDRLHQRGIRLRIVGNLTRFSDDIQERIVQAEARTAGNTGLTLSICADYGGRWDILRATNALLQSGFDVTKPVTEADLAPFLSMAYAPEPDLFIRTGGERRISNFLLWQLAYAELYFTDTLWPDFDQQAFEAAIVSYRSRERRFGRTSEQLPPAQQRP